MATFWIAVGSIATAILAAFTYRSLRQYDTKERRTENRELIEKVIEPLLQNVGSLTTQPIQDFYVGQPSWEATKRQNPVIIYRIPEEIIAEIDALCADIDAIQRRINNNTLLLGIFADRIVEQLKNKPTSYDYGFANHASYRWYVKNKGDFYYTIPGLLCANSTLADEIERSKDGISNPVVEGETFTAGNKTWSEITSVVFDQILTNVKNNITGSPDLAEYVQMFRDLRPKAETLKSHLDMHKRRLAR